MMREAAEMSPLTRLAQELRADPRYMAYALAAYQRQEGMDGGELAQTLGLAPEMATRLALCRRPDAHSPHFAAQVREIADYTLADEGQLANLLRQVGSLEQLAQHRPAADNREEAAELLPSGLLAAARDREEDEEDSPTDAPEGQ
jgi:hypothetical protein